MSEIVVDAPAGGFIPGKWYYIVTLPATLSKGYTLSFEGDKPMGSRVSDKQVTIRRAVWGVLEEADGIRVSKDAFSFKSVGGSATLTVIAGGEWTASSDASWCTVTPASGSGKADVTLQVAQNEAEASRSASIVFEMADHSQRRTVNVTQDGYHTLPEGIDWSRPFHHKSLVMKFTATWCGYCPIMAQAVDLAMEQHPGKLEAVNIHGGGSDYVFSNYSVLTSLYSISGYPSGIVDGRREIQNYAYTTTASNIGKYMAETEDNYPVSSAIGLSSTLSGRKLSLDLQLFIKDEASYKVTVMLLENGIIGYQEDYNEGNHQDYRHDHVARMALTNVLGDSFSTSYDFERKDLRYSADIPSSYNLENMTVLVYVQRAYGSLPVVGTNYGGYFVDNAISAPVDTTVEPAVD